MIIPGQELRFFYIPDGLSGIEKWVNHPYKLLRNIKNLKWTETGIKPYFIP